MLTVLLAQEMGDKSHLLALVLRSEDRLGRGQLPSPGDSHDLLLVSLAVGENPSPQNTIVPSLILPDNDHVTFTKRQTEVLLALVHVVFE